MPAVIDESTYANDMDEIDDLVESAQVTNSSSSSSNDRLFDDTEFELLDDDIAASPSRDERADRSVSVKSAIGDRCFDCEAADDEAADFFFTESREVAPCPSRDERARQPSSVGTSAKHPDLTPEQVEKKRQIAIKQIAAYRQTWPYLEQKMTFPVSFNKKNLDKLEEMLEECSGHVQSTNTTRGFNMLFNGFAGKIETICTKYFTFIELQGFARRLETDAVVQDSLKELEIKYLSASGVMKPEVRLLMGLFFCAYTTHCENRDRRIITTVAKSLARPIPKEFEDL